MLAMVTLASCWMFLCFVRSRSRIGLYNGLLARLLGLYTHFIDFAVFFVVVLYLVFLICVFWLLSFCSIYVLVYFICWIELKLRQLTKEKRKTIEKKRTIFGYRRIRKRTSIQLWNLTVYCFFFAERSRICINIFIQINAFCVICVLYSFVASDHVCVVVSFTTFFYHF